MNVFSKFSIAFSLLLSLLFPFAFIGCGSEVDLSFKYLNASFLTENETEKANISIELQSLELPNKTVCFYKNNFNYYLGSKNSKTTHINAGTIESIALDDSNNKVDLIVMDGEKHTIYINIVGLPHTTDWDTFNLYFLNKRVFSGERNFSNGSLINVS